MGFQQARSLAGQLLKRAIARETHLGETELYDDEPFERYGIESVMMVAITRHLEEDFGELSKTLFFEYQTIGELADYFAEDFVDVLDKLAGVETVQAADVPVAVQEPVSVQELAAAQDSAVVATPTVTAQPSKPSVREDVAIVGISGRFPMADNLQEFWENLTAGTDCISEVPPELWDWQEYWDEERGKDGKSYSKWGGFMSDVDKFDPLFFNISNLEAESLDPQERLFLETVYHTLEDAGYTKESLRSSRVGVYVGAMWTQYQLYGVDFANAGSSVASIANRVSYFFDFNGPSIALDTMCSSSLTTVHLACESLHSGEIDVAIAGGVNITVHPNKYLFLSKTGFASTDGRCRSFGEGGDGYVPGDGVGALMLKPLSKAIADGDQIYGVIKSTAINHGGKVNGYTVPNPKAQSMLIQEGLDKAGISPRTIGYLEAHGTGTALGDPIEVRALTNVFEPFTDDKQFCPIGSVKSNIGHLESAAGFAGIAKVLMQMKHRKLVQSIHSDTLNPNIDFSKTPFYVQRELTDWVPTFVTENDKQVRVPRRAGVSSFGAGGANGFVLLEEYVPQPAAEQAPPADQLIVLSAKNDERLHESVDRLIQYLMPDSGSEKAEAAAQPASVVAQLVQEWVGVALGVGTKWVEDEDSLDDLGLDRAAIDRLCDLVNDGLGLEASADQLMHAVTMGGLKQEIEHLHQGQPKSAHQDPSAHLAQIAYTLQVGRETMNSRLALLVHSVEELADKLRRFRAGEQDIDGVWQGFVSPRNVVEPADENDREFLFSLLKGRKLAKLARIWIKGLSIPWTHMYSEQAPQKISLPLYPFAKERCWVSQPARAIDAAKGQRSSSLLGEVVPSLSLDASLVYGKTFDATDLKVHGLTTEQGTMLSPASGVEMMLMAGRQFHESGVLQSVEWQESLPVHAGETVLTAVQQQEQGLRLQLRGNRQGHAAAQALYREGSLFDGVKPAALPVREIMERCQNRLTKMEIDIRLRDAGVRFGTAQRGLEEFLFNETEAMGRYRMPVAAVQKGTGFVAHPAILESVFHGGCLLLGESGEENKMSIGAIEWLRPLESQGHIYFRLQREGVYEALVVDGDGEVGLVLKEICFSKPDELGRFFYQPEWLELDIPSPAQTETVGSGKHNTLLIYPEQAEALAAEIKRSLPGGTVYEIVLSNKTDLLSVTRWKIDTLDPLGFSSCLAYIDDLDDIYFLGGVNADNWHPVAKTAFDRLQAQSVTALFRLLKGLDERNLNKRKLQLKVLTNFAYQVLDQDIIQPFTAGVLGLAKTASREYPNLSVTLADLEIAEGGVVLTEQMARQIKWVVQGIEGEQEYALRNERAYKRVLKPHTLPANAASQLRQQGVYVIVGGSGNVGLRMSRYLAETRAARLVWLGRRQLDDSIRAKMTDVESLGGTVTYHAVDVADEQQMADVFAQIEQSHGGIHGVIHSAMAFEISRLQNLDDEQFAHSLRAKVDGSYVLFKTLRSRKLDFMLFFSSGESFTGNIGWGAYAAACNFKDAFALHMRQEAPWPVHVINWGFWEGNDRGDADILRTKGIYPIAIEQGAQALERVVACDVAQVMALNVEDHILERMGVVLPERSAPKIVVEQKQEVKPPEIVQPQKQPEIKLPTPSVTAQVAPAPAGQLTVAEVSDQIKDMFADVLKISKEKFDEKMDLAMYGVDSLIVINLHKALEDGMGTLPATLIIEYQTIEEIANYLVENHPEAVSQLAGLQTEATVVEAAAAAEVEPAKADVDQDPPVPLVEVREELQPGVIENVEVLRKLAADEIGGFLTQYGELYREGMLRNEENSAFHERFNLHEETADGMVHFLMQTPSCERVEVIVAGKGTPVVLMPAVALTVPVWYRQFLSMRDKYQFIVIHSPGYGLSQTIREGNTKGVATVFSEVLEQLNLGRSVHLVGSCFGSIAATYLANFHAEQVASLSLVGGFYDNSDLPQIDMSNLKIEEIMGMVQVVSNSLQADFDAVSDNLKPRDKKKRAEIKEMCDLLLNSQCANPLTAMKYLNEMLTLSTLDWLKEIKVPMQCIYGDLDTVVSPERSRVIHEVVAHSQLIEIPGSGHYPFLTHPEQFDPILDQFLSKLEESMAMSTR